MTLHKLTEIAKKVGIILGIIIGTGMSLYVLVQTGTLIRDMISPPPIQPPTHVYNTLPPLQFPKNAVDTKLTYTLNTITGGLPDFPDRLNVYPIKHNEPSLLNLNKVKTKVAGVGFLDYTGYTLPEKYLGDVIYEWDDQKDFTRKLVFNIVTFNFNLDSNYLFSFSALGARRLSTQGNAILTTKTFLENMGLFPTDIDLTKTKPQLLSIKNGALTPTTSLSKTQVIRVDLYQKDMQYALNTGIPQKPKGFKLVDIQLPIMYPNPPYSTMSFWIASSENGPTVGAARFFHQDIILPKDLDATYGIKTAKEAFEELQKGKSYIASYDGFDSNIAINDVYLAYYAGDQLQSYLMPIIVFEGKNGFFAYVSAVKNDWIK